MGSVDGSTLPVHGELGHQRDICGVGGRLRLIVQEVQVGAVHGETLTPEFIAQVIFVQLRQLLLELPGARGQELRVRVC